MWTDEFGQTWELVRQRETCDVSDATLAFVLAMVCLVPGLAILAANVIWGLPEWLAPVDGALLLFGLANVIVSAKEQGL
jgi:hypothetical protein